MGHARIAAIGATFLAATSLQASASISCTASDTASPLEVARIQQRLMVAALTCGDISRYNHFVRAYQPELQASDAALLTYFRHGHGGEAAYHTYKTHLANAASLSSIHGQGSFCRTADDAFEDASEG